MLTLLKPLGLFFIGPFQDVVDKLRPLSLKFQKGEFSFQYSKQSWANKVRHRRPSGCTYSSNKSHTKWTESERQRVNLQKQWNKWKEKHRKSSNCPEG